AEEKVALVLEAAAVPEAELGAFLRRKGVHEAQLAEWRQQVTQGAVAALRGPSKRDRKAASIEARRFAISSASSPARRRRSPRRPHCSC
ncbi:MAG: hypothetical protein ACKV2T_00225, partial [Kofleriaceae bacterium]